MAKNVSLFSQITQRNTLNSKLIFFAVDRKLLIKLNYLASDYSMRISQSKFAKFLISSQNVVDCTYVHVSRWGR